MAKKKVSYRGYSPRRVNVREIRQRFLIVCEGEKTEPNYFRSFRVPKVVIDIQGLGRNPSSLVNKARKLKNQEDYDQIWCVFDRDSWTEADFNGAIRDAKVEGFGVAYSNQSFELWYILHFEFLNTGISRTDYIKRLSDLLGYEYQKNSEEIYDKIINRQTTAIKNAENLLKEYDSYNPASNNPSTTVHLLVRALNKFVQ
jgi:hypothetical protein